jgi:hypothetical protein
LEIGFVTSHSWADIGLDVRIGTAMVALASLSYPHISVRPEVMNGFPLLIDEHVSVRLSRHRR